MAKNTAKQKFKTYTPQNGDTLKTIARRETDAGNKTTAEAIAKFNWGTDDADTIQEKLRDQLGCHRRGSDNKYVITADCKSGVLKIPIKYKLKSNQTNKFFKIRVKRKRKPPKQFIACAKVKGITFDSHQSFIKPSVVDTLRDLARELNKYPKGQVMVWGHVDDDEKKADDDSYAKKLSDNRAKSVHAFILNDVDTWMKLYKEEGWNVSVFHTILTDLGKNLQNPNTQAAIKKYQQGKGFGGNGSLTDQTKKELFKDYMKKHDVDLPGVDKDRFMDPTYMGCSYFNMEGAADKMNRRVLFFLFHKDRLPVLPCSLGDTFPCTKQMKPPKHRYSKTYQCSFYDSVAKGCDRMVADAAQAMLWVYLKLAYVDPEDSSKTRPFPKDLEVTLVFKDKSTQKAKLKEGGLLEALVATSKQEFYLRFQSKKAQYVVVEQQGQATQKAELKAEADVEELVKKKHRCFQLPKKFSTEDSDWECNNVYHDDDKGRWRVAFAAPGAIGTKASPALYKLDPHWLHARFEFFDRKYGHSHHADKRVSIPPVLLRGMRKVRLSKVSTKLYKSPDAACAWGVSVTDAAKACQAIPFIVSKHSKGSKKGKDLAKLDKQIVLEFGHKDLYVQSNSATERVLVKLDPADAAQKTKLEPNKDRPQYYDIPKLWKSCNQDIRVSIGGRKSFNKLTEAEVGAASSAAKALIFSLDDIVLVGKTGKQVIKDKKKNNGSVSLSEHSRISLMYMDYKKKFKIKVYQPWDNIFPNINGRHIYWSNVSFKRNLNRKPNRTTSRRRPTRARRRPTRAS